MTHSLPLLIFLSLWFNSIKYVHILVQLSSRPLPRLQNQTSVPIKFFVSLTYQLQTITVLFAFPLRLTTLDTSAKEGHTACVCDWLVSLIILFSCSTQVVGYIRICFLLGLNNIPSYSYSTFCSFIYPPAGTGGNFE